MTVDLHKYRLFIYVALVVIAFGVLLSTNAGDSTSTFGTVLIAVGGLFFIIGMSKKPEKDSMKENPDVEN